VARYAVNRTRGAKEHFRNAKFAAKVEQVERPCDVHPFVKARLLKRRADSGARCQVDEGVETHLSEQFSQKYRIAYVCLQELEIAGPTNFFKVGSLPVGRIEIIEIVHNRKFRALAEKSFSNVRANESRPASQKHPLCLLAQFPSYVRLARRENFRPAWFGDGNKPGDCLSHNESDPNFRDSCITWGFLRSNWFAVFLRCIASLD
jgi:hypothetical protein